LDTPCLPSVGGRQRRCTDDLTYCHDDNFCLCQDDSYRRAGACGKLNKNNIVIVTVIITVIIIIICWAVIDEMLYINQSVNHSFTQSFSQSKAFSY